MWSNTFFAKSSFLNPISSVSQYQKSCRQVNNHLKNCPREILTMSINYSFAGKKVLITGGAQGIGRELVQTFYDGGATVFTLDKNPETIEKLREELPGVRAEIVDLTDWEATKKIVESFGPIQHLVNNAGIVSMQTFMNASKDMAKQFDVNVGAAINVTQAVAKGLIDANSEGSVVNMCSIGGRIAAPIGFVVYGATKAALENLTKTMALELGANNIRVNCVVPGSVEAPMITNSPELVAFIEKEVFPRMIVKRLVKASEVADTVMFLLSPLSAMIVGQSIVVDGGYLVT